MSWGGEYGGELVFSDEDYSSGEPVVSDTSDITSSSDTDSGSTDFLSPRFNALKALNTPGLQLPVPDAPPLDNVSKCRSILPAEIPESLVHVKHRPASEVRAAGTGCRPLTHTAIPGSYGFGVDGWATIRDLHDACS